MSLHLDVNPQLEALFVAEAKKKGVNQATLLEEILSGYLKTGDEETVGDIGDFGGRSVADMILEIGTVKSGLSDLSTNPKYMEGFGEQGSHR